MIAPICHVVSASAAAAPDCHVLLDIHLHGACEFHFLIPPEKIPDLAAELLFAAREATSQPASKKEESAR